jgi:hypothetical protein
MQTGGNILLTSLFHAAQSFFVIVNEGIPPTQQVWLMAGVYLALALIVATLMFNRQQILVTRQPEN